MESASPLIYLVIPNGVPTLGIMPDRRQGPKRNS